MHTFQHFYIIDESFVNDLVILFELYKTYYVINIRVKNMI